MQDFEPALRQRAVDYLSQRFASEVELKELHVHLPSVHFFRALFHRNEGAVAEVQGADLVVRYHKRTDLPPLFEISAFKANIGLEGLVRPSQVVQSLEIDGMEIHIPPREDENATNAAEKESNKGKVTNLAFSHARIRNAHLVLLPKDASKKPLEFQIANLDLDTMEQSGVVRYQSNLTNPKPPGDITSDGMFGPWDRDNPGATPLSGQYDFKNADLSVFPAIAGTLHSTGTFTGELSEITAKGEATVPNFRLTRANNPLPLKTTFEVMVDGTNGNTELRPVHAVLGTTAFTTSGAVLKRNGEQQRTISLQVHMPSGQLRDLLTLAMAGKPMLQGKINLEAKILIPPLAKRVREKLVIDGKFAVTDGYFLQSSIRQRLDELSRRAQGEPKNLAIEDVMTEVAGQIHLENEQVNFPMLNFSVPGANVALSGMYDMKESNLDFDGTVRLDAKISQTMTGWKRILIKPFDPIFAKDGAGAVLPLEISGSADHPKFGISVKRALSLSKK
jgi:hypothetical protein